MEIKQNIFKIKTLLILSINFPINGKINNTNIPEIKLILPTSLSVNPFSIKNDGKRELQPASLIPKKNTQININLISIYINYL